MNFILFGASGSSYTFYRYLLAGGLVVGGGVGGGVGGCGVGGAEVDTHDVIKIKVNCK